MNGPPGIWDLASGRTLQLLGDHVRADLVTFSHDSRLLAYGGGRIGRRDDLDIWLVDATTGQLSKRLVGHKRKIERFQNLSRTIDSWSLAASRTGTVRFWDVKSGTESEQFEASAFALSPKGTFAICGKDEAVRVGVVVRPRKELRKLDGNSGPQRILEFAPDGKTLFGENPTKPLFHIWDLATGQARIVSEPEIPPQFGEGSNINHAHCTRRIANSSFWGFHDGFIRFWERCLGPVCAANSRLMEISSCVSCFPRTARYWQALSLVAT